MNAPAGSVAQRPRVEPSIRSATESEGRRRVIVENVTPQVDCGRFPVKRTVGETIRVESDAFVEGHDKLRLALRHRAISLEGRPMAPQAGRLNEGDGAWDEVEMEALVNDRWCGEFQVQSVGWHEFTVLGWVDRFRTWRYDLQKRVAAGQNVTVDLQIGAELIEQAAAEAEGQVRKSLEAFALFLRSEARDEATEVALGASLQQLMKRHGRREFVAEMEKPIRVWVDRSRARFSSWYELFPRSASLDVTRHGTLRDVENRLDYVAEMGFDVLYLPPIHPIGHSFRKGKNNSPVAEPGDVGSPWAIGSEEGGHDAIHPELGTFEDFDRLVKSAKDRGIEIAMDMAFQCSPDHPYLKEHPEWFKHRPDASIQYAENPPKKYQDIYPFDFECADWQGLWNELLRVVLLWNERGVRLFRVDNPHTKPFAFWEWLIWKVKERDPGSLFLSEAFTRPKVMYRLAKLGFTQSYTYFAWRTEPWGIKQYFTELTSQPVVDFFKPNAWPNTPDILNDYLQADARAAYMVRLVLAATLCGNYGIYGPVFELMEGQPVRKGSEEYLNSEKYQVRHWDLSQPNWLAELIARINRIRKANPALQHDRSLTFHNVDNPTIVCYSKREGDNVIFVAVNTDPYNTQWGNIDLDLKALGVAADQQFQMHDLLTDLRYRWQGSRAVVGLDPGSLPVHVFAVRRYARTEADFEYFV